MKIKKCIQNVDVVLKTDGPVEQHWIKNETIFGCWSHCAAVAMVEVANVLAFGWSFPTLRGRGSQRSFVLLSSQ
jgi:hypothetical protein